MEPIPLPSPIHYELVLQLLERQTMLAVRQNPVLYEQVTQLLITLRKAAAQQKQVEAICQQTQQEFEFRWSINHHCCEPASFKEDVTSQQPSV